MNNNSGETLRKNSRKNLYIVLSIVAIVIIVMFLIYWYKFRDIQYAVEYTIQDDENIRTAKIIHNSKYRKIDEISGRKVNDYIRYTIKFQSGDKEIPKTLSIVHKNNLCTKCELLQLHKGEYLLDLNNPNRYIHEIKYDK